MRWGIGWGGHVSEWVETDGEVGMTGLSRGEESEDKGNKRERERVRGRVV